MQLLITASIGLYYVKSEEKFYLQIITAEEYNHYFMPLTQNQAQTMSIEENIEISEIEVKNWED